ncbi:sushi domain-containing protein 4-like isoform X3 [Tachypleus tridentatus]|uniref:sushi domain-containing protein 4-like isoform X3 n=1 Tax=Tachypleus tridentatus TaxID=6853 RepID=UPI003FD416C7
MSRCSGYSQLLVVCTFVMTLIERSSCAKVCTPLPTIENGNVHNVDYYSPVGTEVQYSCHKGYYLEGKQTRRCLESQVWSDKEPKCLIIDCGFVIYNNPNGKVVHVNGTTTFGSVLQLRCNEGYKVVGGQNIMVCQNNSRWSNINLHCAGNGRSTMSSTKLIATVIGLFLLAVLMVTVVVMLKKRKQQLKYAAHTNRTRTFLYRPSKEIGAFLYIKSSGSGQYLNLLEEDIEEENAEDSMTRRPLPPDSISDQHSSVEVLEQHNQYKIPT